MDAGLLLDAAPYLLGGGSAQLVAARYGFTPGYFLAPGTRQARRARARIRRKWYRHAHMLGMTVKDPTPTRWQRLRRITPTAKTVVPKLRTRVDRYSVTVDARTLPGIGPTKWESAAEHLVNGWEVARVRITNPVPGLVRVRAFVREPLDELLPSPLVRQVGDHWQCAVTPGSLTPHDPIMWGVTEDGDEVTASLAELIHGLIAGASRSGKSIELNTLLAAASLSRYVRVTILDPNLGAAAPWWRTAYRVTDSTDPDDATAILEEITAELEQRKDLFWAHRTDQITQFSDDEPLHLVIIDEAAGYTRHPDRKKVERFTAALLKFAAQSAKYGGRLWLATQKPGSDVLNTTIRMNLTARICFRVDTVDDFVNVFSDGRTLPITAADRTLPRGVGIAAIGDMRTPARFRGVYLPTEACWAIADAICASGGQVRPLPATTEIEGKPTRTAGAPAPRTGSGAAAKKAA